METTTRKGSKWHHYGLPHSCPGDQRRGLFLFSLESEPCFSELDQYLFQYSLKQGRNFLNEPMKFEVTDIMEYNVTGLQPDSKYSVQVAALTRKGDGDRSPAIIAKTPGNDLSFIKQKKTHDTKLLLKHMRSPEAHTFVCFLNRFF